MSFFTRRQPSVTSPKANEPASSPAKAKDILTSQILKQAAKSKIPEWDDVLAINSEALRIWRMDNKEQLTEVPTGDHGFFFSDESYIVVKTFNHKKRLCYNIHFWFGAEKAKKNYNPPSKVQQLIQLLNERVVVYREVEGYESPVFRSYFQTFGVHQGTVADAFDPKSPEKFKKRLLHFRWNENKERTEVREVPISRKSLKSWDVFIFDEGTKMSQWNGRKCDEEERTSARAYIANALKKRKTTCTSELHDEEDLFDSAEIYKKLGTAEVPARPKKLDKDSFQKSMYRLSDKSGKLTLTSVPVARTNLFPEDVAFLDARSVLYVQIGPTSSDNEKNGSWVEADKYLKSKNCQYKSICLFNAGSPCPPFERFWTKKD